MTLDPKLLEGLRNEVTQERQSRIEGAGSQSSSDASQLSQQPNVHDPFAPSDVHDAPANDLSRSSPPENTALVAERDVHTQKTSNWQPVSDSTAPRQTHRGEPPRQVLSQDLRSQSESTHRHDSRPNFRRRTARADSTEFTNNDVIHYNQGENTHHNGKFAPFTMCIILVIVSLLVCFFIFVIVFGKGTFIQAKDAIFALLNSASSWMSLFRDRKRPVKDLPASSSPPSVFRNINNWSPALDIATDGIKRLGDRVAMYGELPTGGAKQLQAFNTDFMAKLTPLLAQDRHDMRFLPHELAENANLHASLQASRSSRTELQQDLKNIMANVVKDFHQRTCRLAIDLQQQRGHQLRSHPAESRDVDTHISLLIRMAETVDFGCKMCGTDREQAERTLSVFDQELNFFQRVI
ncbi:hypothetical protein ACHAQK_007634 [Fusarium lateritium]